MVLAAGVFETPGAPGVPCLAGGGNGADAWAEICVRSRGAPLQAGQTDGPRAASAEITGGKEGNNRGKRGET